jgi:hypothetical protein
MGWFYLFFIYHSFNIIFISSDSVPSNHRMIDEKWIGYHLEGNGRTIIWSTIQHFPRENENFLKSLRISIVSVEISTGHLSTIASLLIPYISVQHLEYFLIGIWILNKRLKERGTLAVWLDLYDSPKHHTVSGLRNWGIEFMLATLKEIQLAALNVLFPFVYTL